MKKYMYSTTVRSTQLSLFTILLFNNSHIVSAPFCPPVCNPVRVMLVVGLTGGIASGKSTVSSLLRDKHRIPLIDLDVLAREVVRPEDPSRTLSRLVAHFGRSILRPEGEDGTLVLDRPTLGRLCFGNEENRKVLNRITHGAIRKRMVRKLIWSWLVKGEKVVVVDTPLLVEAGLWKWCGLAVLAWW